MSSNLKYTSYLDRSPSEVSSAYMYSNGKQNFVNFDLIEQNSSTLNQNICMNFITFFLNSWCITLDAWHKIQRLYTSGVWSEDFQNGGVWLLKRTYFTTFMIIIYHSHFHQFLIIVILPKELSWLVQKSVWCAIPYWNQSLTCICTYLNFKKILHHILWWNNVLITLNDHLISKVCWFKHRNFCVSV